MTDNEGSKPWHRLFDPDEVGINRPARQSGRVGPWSTSSTRAQPPSTSHKNGPTPDHFSIATIPVAVALELLELHPHLKSVIRVSTETMTDDSYTVGVYSTADAGAIIRKAGSVGGYRPSADIPTRERHVLKHKGIDPRFALDEAESSEGES